MVVVLPGSGAESPAVSHESILVARGAFLKKAAHVGLTAGPPAGLHNPAEVQLPRHVDESRQFDAAPA